MNIPHKIQITLCCIFCLILSNSLQAINQQQSSIQIVGSVGYNQLYSNTSYTSTLGGSACLFSVRYQKNIQNFLLCTGIESGYSNSITNRNPFSLNYPVTYQDDDKNLLHLISKYDISKYKENRRRLHTSIPLLAGYSFGNHYVLIGTKFIWNYWGTYQTSCSINKSLYDPELIDIIDNIPTHDLTKISVNGQGELNFNYDITASIEWGVSIDQWIPRSIQSYKYNKRPYSISYTIGLFCDYGLLDINNNTIIHDESVIINTKQEVENTQCISLLSSSTKDNHTAYNLNNICIGFHFIANFQIPNKKKSHKRDTKHVHAKIRTSQKRPTIEHFVLPKKTPIKLIEKKDTTLYFEMKNLYFQIDQTKILAPSQQTINDLYHFLIDNPLVCIEIQGHTDNTGNKTHNKKLSQGRALAVYNAMINKGIPAYRMQWKGFGQSRPIVPNNSPENKHKNRRVEIHIIQKTHETH